MRDKPIGTQILRLNHSAIVSSFLNKINLMKLKNKSKIYIFSKYFNMFEDFPPELFVHYEGKYLTFKSPVPIKYDIRDKIRAIQPAEGSIIIIQKPRSCNTYQIRGGNEKTRLEMLKFVLNNILDKEGKPLFEQRSGCNVNDSSNSSYNNFDCDLEAHKNNDDDLNKYNNENDNSIGNYKKIERIHQGRFGIVWKCVHKYDEKIVVIKEIPYEKETLIINSNSFSSFV